MVKAPQPARVPGPPIHTESQERERDLGAPSPLAKVEIPVPEQRQPDRLQSPVAETPWQSWSLLHKLSVHERHSLNRT